MKCDVCGKPATIEEVTKVGDAYTYKHLCEACAASAGVLGVKPDSTNQKADTAKAIAQIAGVRQTGAGPCDSCGMTLDEFRKLGRLGCPRCYASFERQLGPLIARAHEGSTHHVGKVPKRLLGSAMGDDAVPHAENDSRAAIEHALGQARQREEKLRTLKRQLSDSLRAERYEQAAMIRDEITKLQTASATAEPTNIAQSDQPPRDESGA